MKDLKNLGIQDYLGILWRRRWYGIITAVIVASGVAASVWQLPNLYKSETRILVEAPFVSEDYVRPIIRATPADRINSIHEQISSRTFLERIVEQFQYGGYGTRSDFVMEDAIKSLRKQIQIEKTSDETFTLSFTSTDPSFAREVTKRLADEVIRANTAARMDKVLATDQFIDEQLRQAAQALADQEEKIKKFKTAHLGELPEQSDSNMNTLSGLYTQLSGIENALQQAREQQKGLEYRLQERKRLNLLAQSVANSETALKKPEKRDSGLTALESELASKKSLLDAMKLKYTAKHPDVESLSRQIHDLEQQLASARGEGAESGSSDSSGMTPLGQTASVAVPADRANSAQIATEHDAASQFESESIKNQIEKREKERQEIQRQIKAYQARLNLAPALEQELSSLLREEEIQKQQYINLKNKKLGSQMAATVETDKKNETYKIIDEPNLPVKPEYPNRVQLILMGIGGGLGLGLIAAFGRELLDSTIGSEDEASTVLNLPVLVSIFEIPDEGMSIRKALKPKERTA
jgi:polysaccharide biosynthesis transport protein